MFRKILWLAAILTVSLLCCAARPVAAAQPKRGSAAPSFSLPDLNGRELQSGQWKGKTVVLNFWAFWCDTWKDEMPQLLKLAGRQKDLGFQLVAISVDGTRVQEFLRRTGGKTPFPVLLDLGGHVSEQYGVSHVPTVVVIDPTGRIQYVHSGYPGNPELLTALRAASSGHGGG